MKKCAWILAAQYVITNITYTYILSLTCTVTALSKFNPNYKISCLRNNIPSSRTSLFLHHFTVALCLLMDI